VAKFEQIQIWAAGDTNNTAFHVVYIHRWIARPFHVQIQTIGCCGLLKLLAHGHFENPIQL
jgi:hypothetical protein